MTTGIERSITALHNEKKLRFVMDIPIKGVFENSLASEYFGWMVKGFDQKNSEMLLMMAKMVKKMEEESDGMA